MPRLTLLLAAGLALVAVPATAQSWGGTYNSGYSYGGYSGPGDYGYGRRSDGNAVPSSFDWRGQLDRPGDYRCDAFWDASRSDCGERWRDQRSRVSSHARQNYRQLAGSGRDGYGHDRYGHDSGYGHYGYSRRGRGYGSAHGYGAGSDQGGAAFYGAYGRPDLVYPNAGRPYGSNGSQRSRADWCRATWRSYNPHTGYYRAYSGRLIYCG